MDINTLLWQVAGSLGLAPGNLAIILGLLVFASNATSRLIPDTATGVLGKLRVVASWIGLHIRNNSGTASVSTGIPGVVLPTEPTKFGGEPAATLGELAEIAPPASATLDPFGKGASVLGMLLVVFMAGGFLSLTGCATLSDSQVSNYTCTHQLLLTTGANAALANANLIQDPVARQAAIDAANTTLSLVAMCPVGKVN